MVQLSGQHLQSAAKCHFSGQQSAAIDLPIGFHDRLHHWGIVGTLRLQFNTLVCMQMVDIWDCGKCFNEYMG